MTTNMSAAVDAARAQPIEPKTIPWLEATTAASLAASGDPRTPPTGQPKVMETADENDAGAIERMVDEGSPIPGPKVKPVRKSRWRPVKLVDEPSAVIRAANRRAAARLFRVYCFACGRSTTVSAAPARPGRCEHCGGTMQVEWASE